MVANLITVIGLGFAGIDPVGMMLLITALTAGLPKSKVYQFGFLVLFGTTLLGVTLSSLLGTVLSSLTKAVDSLSDTSWVVIGLFLVILLTAWGFKRLYHKDLKEEKEDKASGKGIYAAAAFLVFTAVTDPTFIAVLALSGRQNHLLWEIIYSLIWTLISQGPLFLLIVAVIFNKHDKFIKRFNNFYNRHKPLLGHCLTGLIFLGAAAFALDLMIFWLTGTWLIG